MATALEESVVTDTVSELADPDALSRDYIKMRLDDWQHRVHALYAEIEGVLPARFVVDRSGKQISREELVLRANLDPGEIPHLDILRVDSPDGRLRALLTPRALWIIGANGRLDLRLSRPIHRQSIFRIVDTSRPMRPPSQWSISPLGDPMESQPFSGQALLSMMK